MKLIFFLFTFFPIFKASACPEGQYQVIGHHRSGYTRYDGTSVSATFVKTYCKDFSPSYLYLKNLFNDGFPKDWPHKEIPKKWKEEERLRLIEALENVPDILLSKNLKGIYRMLRSKDFPNPATSTNQEMVLYDSAFKNTSPPLDRVLAHEFSHQHFIDLTEVQQQSYREATGWYKDLGPGKKLRWYGRADGYVAEDGRDSFEEDYANNIEYYLYDSDKLKKVTPSAYKWIQEQFGDKLKQKKGKK